jgi:hypothetical protein
VDANLRLGYRYTNGVGVAQNSAQSLQYFTAAYQAKNAPPSAAAWMGNAMASSQSSLATQNQGYALIQQASNVGDPTGITFLGWLYQHGVGRPKDLHKAEQLYIQVGTKFALSQRFLGEAYLSENPPQYSKAALSYLVAASAGDSKSALRLGQIYLKGHGVVEDHGKAAEWIARSAESGDQEGVFQRGLLYLRGFGVPKSLHLAAEDFARAAQAGFVPAEAQFGWCYATGVGVQKDVNKAIYWLSLAAPKTPDAAVLLAKLRGSH